MPGRSHPRDPWTVDPLRDPDGFLARLRRRRAQEERALPVLRVRQEGQASGVLLAGELALLYGEAKGGKSRAAVALLSWGSGGGGQAVRSPHWEVLAPLGLRFYLYHRTETRFTHLRRYARQMGAERALEDNFLPFETTEELHHALRAITQKALREGQPALVVVDSLTKLLPPSGAKTTPG